MQIFHSLINNNNTPLALTIGHFDGVHVGHQTIIKALAETARANKLITSAMTFLPHARIFFDNADDFLITSDAEKNSMIAKSAIDRLYQIPFDTALSKTPPRDFVDTLIHRLNVKYLLVGDDFCFGNKGQGNFSLLEEMCAANGVVIANTPTIMHEGERISSSRVRKAIKASDFPLVNVLLGRQLCYRGEVITGKQLGRTINFPTANVRLPVERLLPDGVFAVKISVVGDSNEYIGMSNIGTKPTVDDSNTRQIETHLFDFSDDLYGKEIIITPVAKLRDEQKFDGISALITQLHIDKQRALNILSS